MNTLGKKGTRPEERSAADGQTRAASLNAKNVVLSLAKGFRVLEVFEGRQPDLTLTEIAKKAGLDAGTAYRLIKTLLMLGYLHQLDGVKRYRLGLKVLDLGFNAIAKMDFHSSARPLLRSLVGQVNEAASIGVLDGGHIVYVERVQAGLVRLGVHVRIGSRIPAYCTAIGHAILAYLPVEQRMRVLNHMDRVKLTPSTAVTIPEIEERLTRVRKLGYALSDQDTVVGLRVLAAAIVDPDGHPYAAVSVAAPSVACSLDEFVAASAKPVMSVVKDLGRVLSLSGSSAVVTQSD